MLKRRRTALALCVLVVTLVSTGSCCWASNGISTAVDLGLLPGCAVDLAPDMPVTRSLWGLLLYQALGTWLRPEPSLHTYRDLPRDRDGDVLAALVAGGWMKPFQTRGFVPFGAVTVDQALQSMVPAFRAAGGGTATSPGARWRSTTGPHELAQLLGVDLFGDNSLPLELMQAAAILGRAVQLLRPPGDAPVPASAVEQYLRNLGHALETGSMRPPLLPVCGSAAANLDRNSGRLTAGRCSLQLTALDVIRVDTVGLLAVVTARRRMIVSMDGTATESAITDVFRLRLTPAGWRIYR